MMTRRDYHLAAAYVGITWALMTLIAWRWTS